jgi:PTH2 family peptidyl-tRNA hydrolase
MNEIKQVIVMRDDLNMRKGKMIAQGSHGSMAFMSKLMERKSQLTPVQQQWFDSSYAKICVRVSSEEQLVEIYEKAKEAGLEVHLVTDAGRTEFHGVPTKTCLAIGPDFSSKIDPITGDLKLL